MILTAKRRQLRLLAIMNVAAALIGVTVAAAVPRLSADTAFAALGWCTHYTPNYGTWSSTSGWESQMCHQHDNLSTVTYLTNSVAVRTQNTLSLENAAKFTSLWYGNMNGGYECCVDLQVSQYHAIGGSQGQHRTAVCSFPFDTGSPVRLSFYCNTYW